MENTLIIPQDLINFPLKLSSNDISSSSVNHDDSYDSDIEMVDLENKNYTSLKDLISESPPATGSPTNGSWKEIPIKDPLVQHAAWAYLQPMVAPPEDDGGWWRRFEEKCCGVFSCFNDVVLVMFKGWFSHEQGGDGKVE